MPWVGAGKGVGAGVEVMGAGVEVVGAGVEVVEVVLEVVDASVDVVVEDVVVELEVSGAGVAVLVVVGFGTVMVTGFSVVIFPWPAKHHLYSYIIDFIKKKFIFIEVIFGNYPTSKI